MANEAEKFSPGFVGQMAAALTRKKLAEQDAAAVAGLLNALDAEIEVCRSMNLGDDEPAMIYRAVEGESGG